MGSEPCGGTRRVVLRRQDRSMFRLNRWLSVSYQGAIAPNMERMRASRLSSCGCAIAAPMLIGPIGLIGLMGPTRPRPTDQPHRRAFFHRPCAMAIPAPVAILFCTGTVADIHRPRRRLPMLE